MSTPLAVQTVICGHIHLISHHPSWEVPQNGCKREESSEGHIGFKSAMSKNFTGMEKSGRLLAICDQKSRLGEPTLTLGHTPGE